MNSSDSRPTKDTKRPRTDGADDRTRMGNPTPGATSRPRTDDAPDEKDGSPPSKSSDDRPTKQQKRPTHEDIPDETAVQLPSGPTYKVSGVKISLRDRSCPAFSLRDHLQGRE